MKHLLKKHWATSCLFGSICMYAQSQTKLSFSYDTAGNQVARYFATSAKNLTTNTEESTEDLENAIDFDSTDLSNYITIYPNPTAGNLRIEWNPLIADSVKEIRITDSGAIFSLLPEINATQNFVDVDLTSYASGLYLIHFVFDDRQLIVKKIIKN